jgi:hypothetical protein
MRNNQWNGAPTIINFNVNQSAKPGNAGTWETIWTYLIYKASNHQTNWKHKNRQNLPFIFCNIVHPEWILHVFPLVFFLT